MGGAIDKTKLDIQEGEYATPIHWRLGRADAQRYRRLSRVFARQIHKHVGREAGSGVVAIDLGCGDGAGTVQLSEALARLKVEAEIHGTDYSERAIHWARTMTQDVEAKGVTFDVAPAEGPPRVGLKERPLVVVLREVIEHLTEDQFAATVRGLKEVYPKGWMVLSTPTINSPVDPKHYRHYTRELAAQWLEDNEIEVATITGFGFRPRKLCSVLTRLKSALNRRPVLWRAMGPLWREVPVELAMTLVAVGRWL